jgi:hypothetical protein
VVNDNTGSTKVRSATNKVSHKEENKISLEDFMIKVRRNRDPDNEKETLQPIIVKDAQDERNEMKYQQRETWMNRDPEEKNKKGETPIQEVNRLLEEQARISYGSKDRERKSKAKKYNMTSQLRAMKAGETTQGTITALLSGTGSDILITAAIEARRKALGGPHQDEDDTDSDAGEEEEEDEIIPETVTQQSRGKRAVKKKVQQPWNSITREYETKQRLCRSRQAVLSQLNTTDQHLTCKVAKLSRNDKIICGNLYHRTAPNKLQKARNKTPPTKPPNKNPNKKPQNQQNPPQIATKQPNKTPKKTKSPGQ